MSSIYQDQLLQAKEAGKILRRLTPQKVTDLLYLLADRLTQHGNAVLMANEKDLISLKPEDPSADRLLLTEDRIKHLANSIREIALLPNPQNEILTEREIEPGLFLQKTTTPMGLIGVIYESRPNVTMDVAALCIRSGNACVLKGGKEAYHSNKALVSIIHEALKEFGLPAATVMLMPTDRIYVRELLEAEGIVDLIIPRGSDQLIQYVRKNSLIPTIETGAGVCHTYVEKSADLDKAAAIIVNAKVSRPTVCNAMDTLLVDQAVAPSLLQIIAMELSKWNVVILGDEQAYQILKDLGYKLLERAEEQDFGKEFLDYKCSVKVVSHFEEALMHISKFSSGHSECIVTQNEALGQRFLSEVDAAAVYLNASTRFTDGGVFGLGAEIGISTQKLHARGPFALEKLMTEKWIIRGNGHIR